MKPQALLVLLVLATVAASIVNPAAADPKAIKVSCEKPGEYKGQGGKGYMDKYSCTVYYKSDEYSKYCYCVKLYYKYSEEKYGYYYPEKPVCPGKYIKFYGEYEYYEVMDYKEAKYGDSCSYYWK